MFFVIIVVVFGKFFLKKFLLENGLLKREFMIFFSKYTSKNQPKCNQSIYNYMRLAVICD
jgi:hypothetical protein